MNNIIFETMKYLCLIIISGIFAVVACIKNIDLKIKLPKIEFDIHTKNPKK